MRWLALPLVAVVFVAGVWITGGVLTNTFWASMILVSAWFLVSGIAVLLVARSRRRLAVPVVAGYLLSAGAVGIVLFLSVARDKVVDETLAAGPQVVQGMFTSGEHHTSGEAAVVRLSDGRHALTISDLDTSAGPDLRVRLQPGDVDLGALKGNRGDQQYTLPEGETGAGKTVVIWCRAFSVAFGSAPLRATSA